jgi:hypothetical protein
MQNGEKVFDNKNVITDVNMLPYVNFSNPVKPNAHNQYQHYPQYPQNPFSVH